jgi:hypothetical protein
MNAVDPPVRILAHVLEPEGPSTQGWAIVPHACHTIIIDAGLSAPGFSR